MRWRRRRIDDRGGAKDLAVRGQGSGVRGQKSEVRSQKSAVIKQTSEVRGGLLASVFWPLASDLWPLVFGLCLLASGFLVFGDVGVVRAVEEVSQDTIQVDSVKVKSPMGALVRSMLLPGWGQLYNEHPRKGALIFSTELILGGAVVYKNRQPSDRQQRNTFFLWFLGVFLYNLADAYVDAHLYGFEEGEVEMAGPPDHVGSEDMVRVTLVRVRF